MRQAGRYLPEYRKIREGKNFFIMCKTPEIATRITLQPVERYDLDAAIIFSDILVPLEPVGFDVVFDEKGPYITNCLSRINKLPEGSGKTIDLSKIDFLFKTIRLVKDELNNRLPLIGFCGAPFTLACYCIEGRTSRTFDTAKRYMNMEQKNFFALMERLTESLKEYLFAQIDAGVDLVQIFDSWAGALSPVDYKTKNLPYIKQLISAVKERNVPVIYYSNGTSSYLDIIKECGAQCISIDWRIDIEIARSILGDIVIQGNLDPAALFKPDKELVEDVRYILSGALKNGQNRYIFNLGHGILKQTDPDKIDLIVDIVHNFSG